MTDVIELQLGDKTYRAAPCGFDLELAAENRLRELREVEFQRAVRLCAGLPDDIQRAVAREAVARLNTIISREQVLYWQSSPSGSAFYLWFHIQKAVPGFTLEQAESLMPYMRKEHWDVLNLADARHVGIPEALAQQMIESQGNG